MEPVVLVIFVLVYGGMIFGRYPGLALDRTGIALLGAIALLATERVTPEAAWESIDVPTVGLLLGLMIVSAQFRLGGFYTRVTRTLAAANVRPETLLAMLVALAGMLSALLANDIVCLAVAPVLVEGCTRRRLNPVPFLLALACAANVGSAATLIGNPQNMLIGQRLNLSFAGYLLDAGVPAALGLAATWWIICRHSRGHWLGDAPVPTLAADPFNAWQTAKGLVLLALLMGAFLLTSWPREVVALAAAGLLLTSRRMSSYSMLALVDWHLLVLFAGLFVVNHAVESCGLLERFTDILAALHLDPGQPVALFVVTVVLSNVVSNVPAVMLLLPSADHPLAGPILALASTLAGNLFIVGSIANIIVVEQAQRLGIRITWMEHARIGVPITMATLLLAAGWLWLTSLHWG